MTIIKTEKLFRLSMALLATGLISTQAVAEDGRDDYDLDDNSWIEINDLADLDEIRNNMDGSSLYGVSTGCPSDGCNGFELTTSLDFDTNADGIIDENDDYWNGGSGWQPIGNSSSRFTAFFRGNEYEIRNLYISRFLEDNVGLFGYTYEADIRDIGIGGTLTSVRGSQSVGILVGFAIHTDIFNTFVTGSVSGSDHVGGLAGRMHFGFVANSFVQTSLTQSYGQTGGLIGGGYNHNVLYSYAVTPNLSGIGTVSGLTAGSLNVASIYSYWDTEVSGTSNSSRGTGLTSLELKCPVNITDNSCTSNPYSDWETEYWDFGNSEEYPALIFNGVPTRDTDKDGVWDFHDAFPNDIAASVDDDNDGKPDAWNQSCDETCQDATSLTLDDDPTTNTTDNSDNNGGTDVNGSSEDTPATIPENSSNSSSGGSAGLLLILLAPILFIRRNQSVICTRNTCAD